MTMSVRVVDKTAGRGTTSRALTVHARTLELYRQMLLAAEVVQRGDPAGMRRAGQPVHPRPVHRMLHCHFVREVEVARGEA